MRLRLGRALGRLGGLLIGGLGAYLLTYLNRCFPRRSSSSVLKDRKCPNIYDGLTPGGKAIARCITPHSATSFHQLG